MTNLSSKAKTRLETVLGGSVLYDPVAKEIINWIDVGGGTDVDLPPGDDLENLVNYAEISDIPTNTLSTLYSETITAKESLIFFQISGTNVAEYRVYINGTIKTKTRTNYLDLNGNILMNGFLVNPADVLEIKVIHYRPDLGDFNVSVFYKLL